MLSNKMTKTSTFSTVTKRRQVDELVATWRSFIKRPTPKGDWLRMMREALGMTTRQVAQKLNVSQPRIVKIEQSEALGTITLKTLRDTANALGCDLVYAVVP